MLTNGKEFNERMTFNLLEYQWHLLSGKNGNQSKLNGNISLRVSWLLEVKGNSFENLKVHSQYVTSVVGDMIIHLSHICVTYSYFEEAEKWEFQVLPFY